MLGPLSRRSCPSPQPHRPDVRLRWRDLLPLVGFLAPTAAIGYGVVLPRSCAAGLNELTIGFASTLAGVAVTYVLGLRSVLSRR
jgi:hypothetical protein